MAVFIRIEISNDEGKRLHLRDHQIDGISFSLEDATNFTNNLIPYLGMFSTIIDSSQDERAFSLNKES